MASMAMAQAVMEHAQAFYNVSTSYVVAECWDVGSVLEELDRVEDETQVPFVLDVDCPFRQDRRGRPVHALIGARAAALAAAL